MFSADRGYTLASHDLDRAGYKAEHYSTDLCQVTALIPCATDPPRDTRDGTPCIFPYVSSIGRLQSGCSHYITLLTLVWHMVTSDVGGIGLTFTPAALMT